jgi:hypothetical protein
LALEPFYGGMRKSMLDALIKRSRHHWTLLKLPPRRIERRLTAAANWFAEHLTRHWAGRLDLLFTSEAMNLADLVRLLPGLAHKPSVVYFHSNQIPDPPPMKVASRDLVNLATALAGTELWFNSTFHLDIFAIRARAMVEKHPELASRDPVPEILAKSRVMPPPIDLQLAGDAAPGDYKRQEQLIFVETRDADMRLLNEGLGILRSRGEKFSLVTVGPVKQLSSEFSRTALAESDDFAHTAGMFQADVFLSTRRTALLDQYAVRAIMANCWPVVPSDGFYSEIIPAHLQERCFYDCTPESLANCVQDAWFLQPPEGSEKELQAGLTSFDVAATCQAMDDRLSEIAVTQEMNSDQQQGRQRQDQDGVI